MDELDLRHEQRLLQVSRVVRLMMDEGLTQKEAVARVDGLSLATFKRWLPRFEEQIRAVAEMAQAQLLQGMVMATEAFPQAVQRQIDLATGAKGDAREWPKGFDRLYLLVERLAGMSPAQEKAPEEFKPSFRPLGGADTVVVQHRDGTTTITLPASAPPVIDATALPVHDDD